MHTDGADNRRWHRRNVAPHNGGATMTKSASQPHGAADAVSQLGDTVRWQEGVETVVRPALAVLYRLAIGPGADRYAPRFLAFEQGRARPGWHWPSFFLPSVWAFYRRLWLAGVAFSLLPIAGVLALGAMGPGIDDASLPWIACAALAIWIVPGTIPALLADSLLYRHVRRLVRRAEAEMPSATKAAARVNAYSPTSPLAAVFGGVALALALMAVLPDLRAAYTEHLVRAKVAATLAAAKALQRQIVDTWSTSRLVPRQTDNDSLRAHAGASHIDEVEVNPASGRVRLVLAPSLPELAGKAILLAPALDAAENVHWLCIPVDIPHKFLPRECRAR